MLPSEILSHIFSFLSRSERKKVRLVCCYWKEVKDYSFPPKPLRLPPEILSHVFSFLPPSKWSQVKLVCHLWRKLGDRVFNPNLVKDPFKVKFNESIKFLLKDGRVNPKGALYHACKIRNIENIRVLLEDGRDHPKDAFIYAYRTGDIESLRVLLKDKRINPADEYTYVLNLAIGTRNKKFFEELLDDPRIDPAHDKCYPCPLDFANGSKRLYFFKLLYERIKPDIKTWWENLCHSARIGECEIIRFLLEKNLEKGQNIWHPEPLHDAIKNGEYKAVKILLEDKRVGLTSLGDSSFYIAAIKGYLKIFQLLFEDRRIYPSQYDTIESRAEKAEDLKKIWRVAKMYNHNHICFYIERLNI